MRKFKTLMQLLLGVTILVVLVFGVNRTSILVEFTVEPASIRQDSVYTATIEDTTVRFIAVETSTRSARFRAIQATGRLIAVPSSGTLQSVSGSDPATLTWTSALTRPYGSRLLLDTLRSAADRWEFLVLALLGFFVSVCLCVLRWGALLRAQGFRFKFGRLLSLYFVGQFFNSFLPGGLSGDLVKAYYIAGETAEKKPEAVATILIDRVIGFFALVAITVTVMCLRLDFFIGDPRMRLVLVFNAVLLAGVVGTALAVFRKDTLERSYLFRRIRERTSLGDTLTRVHAAFITCMAAPRTMALALLYSLGNHLVFMACTVACLGAALRIDVSIADYLSVFPVINAVAAIPLTPGGLGTREGISIYLLGAMGVIEAKALLLSLLIYVTLLFWSIVGGVVYMFYPRARNIPGPTADAG